LLVLLGDKAKGLVLWYTVLAIYRGPQFDGACSIKRQHQDLGGGLRETEIQYLLVGAISGMTVVVLA
jgi:hypothetical protein